jgi:hypothetical protein
MKCFHLKSSSLDGRRYLSTPLMAYCYRWTRPSARQGIDDIIRQILKMFGRLLWQRAAVFVSWQMFETDRSDDVH